MPVVFAGANLLEVAVEKDFEILRAGFPGDFDNAAIYFIFFSSQINDGFDEIPSILYECPYFKSVVCCCQALCFEALVLTILRCKQRRFFALCQ